MNTTTQRETYTGRIANTVMRDTVRSEQLSPVVVGQ